MSLYGVTFKDQLVPCLDDGAMQQKLFADGIVRGCAMSASGSVLTIGRGVIMAAGRLIGNDADLAVSVSATSGYARITLVIDLTGTATTEAFTQVSIRVDTANSQSGFAALTQEDINGGVDTRYEVALAIVSCSASGITIASLLDSVQYALIKSGTSVPTTDDISPGEIYLKYEA